MHQPALHNLQVWPRPLSHKLAGSCRVGGPGSCRRPLGHCWATATVHTGPTGHTVFHWWASGCTHHAMSKRCMLRLTHTVLSRCSHRQSSKHLAGSRGSLHPLLLPVEQHTHTHPRQPCGHCQHTPVCTHPVPQAPPPPQPTQAPWRPSRPPQQQLSQAPATSPRSASWPSPCLCWGPRPGR
jgi:hypothetical protein